MLMPFFKASLQFENLNFLDAYLPLPINLWEVMGGSFDSWVNFKAKDPSFFNFMTRESTMTASYFFNFRAQEPDSTMTASYAFIDPEAANSLSLEENIFKEFLSSLSDFFKYFIDKPSLSDADPNYFSFKASHYIMKKYLNHASFLDKYKK